MPKGPTRPADKQTGFRVYTGLYRPPPFCACFGCSPRSMSGSDGVRVFASGLWNIVWLFSPQCSAPWSLDARLRVTGQ